MKHDQDVQRELEQQCREASATQEGLDEELLSLEKNHRRKKREMKEEQEHMQQMLEIIRRDALTQQSVVTKARKELKLKGVDAELMIERLKGQLAKVQKDLSGKEVVF